jgi:murein DD-endopeptidase MepM/ murein hydrolase activator NlpD
MVLAAVGAAQATGAELDVLLLGAPGERVTLPDEPMQMLRVTRDKDLFEQARRRAADEGRRARWIVVEDATDRVGLALDQVVSGDYDLVMEDLGDIRLGGRIGRGGRIDRAVAPDGPGGITRALLEQTDVPVAIVLDAVRLGVIPPAVVKGGAAAVLAVGLIGSTATVTSAQELAETQTTVSQTVDAYDAALDEAASLGSPAAVDAALTDSTEEAEDEPAPTDTEQEAGDPEAEPDDAEPQPEPEPEPDEPEEPGPEPGPGPEPEPDTEPEPEPDAGADTEPEPASEPAPDEAELSDVAPADLAPEEVVPEAAPEVDAESIEVDDALTTEDVQATQQAADDSAAALDEAQGAFEDAQDQALEAAEDVEAAAAAAEEAAAELAAAEEAFVAASAQTGAAITESAGLSGALPGGASDEELAAAEAAQADALAEVDAATATADEALSEYEQAAGAAAQASADLEAAAEEVTQADAAHQEAVAVSDATEDAYEEAMAATRVSPVPGYEVTTEYGVPGSSWSTGYHTGVDYAAPEGTEVVAAAGGTVVYAQDDGGSYGNRVVIEHEDGYYTTYNHLSEIDVEVGQEVTAGDPIGEVGNTGNSFGAHLHFEVTQGGDGWSSGDFVDPAGWLEGTA